MAVGRTYELKAKFSAEVDGSVNKTFKNMHARLNNIEKKVKDVNGEKVTVQFDERGASALEKRLAKIEAAIGDVGKAKAEPSVALKSGDEARMTKSLDKLERELRGFSRRPYEAELKGDAKHVNAVVNQVKAGLKDISARAYTASIKAEARGFPQVAAQLKLVKEQADALNREKIKLNVTTDHSSLGRLGAGLADVVTKFTSVEAAMQNFSRRAYFFQQAAQVAMFALIGLGAAASGPLLAGFTILGTSLLTVAGGFGLVALAAAPIISHFANAKENAEKLKSAQDQLKSSTEALKTAQEALADAQAGVAEAQRAGQEQIASAIQAHKDALRGVAEAERDAATQNREAAQSAQEASRAVGQAEIAAREQVTAAQRDAASAARDVAQAEIDARENVIAAQQASAEAARAVEEAERQAHEDVQSAIQSHEAALEGLRSAQQDYKDAQEDAADATQEVADATKDYNSALATEQFRLQSMRMDIEGMALSQKQLALDIKEAERELANAETPNERKEAELRLQQLQLQRKQNTLEMAEAQRELNEAEKNGTDELQSAAEERKNALDAQADANQGVKDSLREVKNAEKEVLTAEREITAARKEGQRTINEALRAERLAQQEIKTARREGIQQIKEAQRAEQEAQRAVITARKEGVRQIREAKRAEQEAHRAVSTTRREGIRQIREAERAEKAAQQAITKARDDAARQMAEAMKEVARAQADVAEAAKQVRSDQSAVNALLKSTAGYLQPLIGAVNRFKERYATSFADANVATAKLGTKIVNTGTRQLPMLGQAAERTANRISSVWSRLGNEFSKFGALKSFRKILNQMPIITGRWTSAFGRFGGAFLNIMAQAMPYVRQFSSWVNKTALNLLKWTNSEKGRRQLQHFFESAAPVASMLFKWIMKIAGAIISWSIKHPRELAAVIKMLGQLLMVVAKAAMWVMNQLFKISQAEHPWRRLFLTVVGFRAAIMGLGMAWKLMIGTAIRLLAGFVGKIPSILKWIVQPFWGAIKRIAAAWKVIPKNFTMIMGLLRGSAALAVGKLLLTFGRLTLVGLAFEWIVRSAIVAWGEILNRTIPTIRGLVEMWRRGSMGIGELLWNVFRQVMASLLRIVVGGFIDMLQGIKDLIRSFTNFLSNIFGDINLGDKLFPKEEKAKAEKWLDGLVGMVRGDTNKMAQHMGKNTAKGTADAGKNMDNFEGNTNSTMKNTSGDVSTYLSKMQNNMNTSTKKGSDQGKSNLNDFKLGGMKSMEDLKLGSNADIDKMMSTSNMKTGDMKMKGLGNLEDFKTGGNTKMGDLQTGASTKAALMEQKVSQSTVTTKQKSLEALNNMQESGTATMGVLQQEWVDKAWKTAVYTQESFNAMLEGMGRFIDKAAVSGVKKPEQFSVIGNPHGNMMGNAQDTGGSGKFSTNVRMGGEFRYAQGGTNKKAQGPMGGVAQGTTRVYGEVPGTTEFYITDNKKYRKRNMALLESANRHMMANGGVNKYAKGGEQRFAAGGALPPKGVHGQASSSGLSYSASPAAQSIAQAGAAMWRGLVKAGGGDVNVIIQELGGALRGLTYADGTIKMDPQGQAVAMAHEFGHTLGLGHGGNSIMGGAGMVTANDFAALKSYYGMVPGGSTGGGSTGGAPTGGGGKVMAEDGSMVPKSFYGGSGGSGNTSTINQTQTGSGAQSSTQIQSSGGGGGKGSPKERMPDNGMSIQRAVDKALGKNWMENFLAGMPTARGLTADIVGRNRKKKYAVGGVLETGGRFTDSHQNLLAAERAYSLGEQKHAMGGVYRGGELRNAFGSQNWVPEVAEIVKQTQAEFPDTSMNTYPNHGGRGLWGEQHSVDHWGPGGAGSDIDDAYGDQIVSWQKSNHENDIMYYIWKGTIHGWGESKPYSGYGGAHFDHVHTTYDMGQNYEGSGSLGNGSGSSVDYSAMYDKEVPKMPSDINYGLAGEAMMAAGNKIRAGHKEAMLKKTGDGGTAPQWDGGGNIDEWLKQGLVFGNVFEPSAGNISNLKSRAMQESGGDPEAVNTWDSNAAAGTPSKGLLQVIEPTWNSYMNEYGKSTGAFDSNWNNPIMNTATATRYMKGNYGHIVGASGTGYAEGGIATKPHLGLVGEGKKPGGEMMWPLGSKKATKAVTNAFEASRGSAASSPSGGEPGGANVNNIAKEYTPEAVQERAGVTPEDIDRLVAATEASKMDAAEVADMVLRAIWAGMESAKGAEKVDASLGRRWEKDARTKGEI